HSEYFPIRQQRLGPLIRCGQVATNHQRRRKNRPQCHESLLFAVRKPALPRLPPARSWPEIAEPQHVRVGPPPRLRRADPFQDISKLIAESLWVRDVAVPNVPDVIRNPPHLRVLPHLIDLFERRGSRRQT